MNTYTITNIDLNTSIASADYIYNGHTLSDLVPLSNPTDPTAVTADVLAAYNKYKADMDTIDAAPTLPVDVQALIGQAQEVS